MWNPISKITTAQRAGGMALVPSKCKCKKKKIK
jgi:hypothetical protein